MHTAGIWSTRRSTSSSARREVGGTHCFVFGKHSGAGAVEAAFKKHHGRLEAQGVEVTEALVKNTLERAKELRAKMIENGHAARTIRQHYDNMAQLGISEERLIELALAMHAEQHYSRS